jgi:hypothetical protein
MTPHNPMMAAPQIQSMANKATDERTSKLLMALMVIMLLPFVANESLKFVKDVRKSFVERELERRNQAAEHAR